MEDTKKQKESPELKEELTEDDLKGLSGCIEAVIDNKAGTDNLGADNLGADNLQRSATFDF